MTTELWRQLGENWAQILMQHVASYVEKIWTRNRGDVSFEDFSKIRYWQGSRYESRLLLCGQGR